MPALDTAPLRLAKNVKEFGAKGDGTTDDRAAIQACFDWTASANRGEIFFPPGTYKVSGPISYEYNGELSMVISGVGNLSTIIGNFPGYILSRHNANPTSGIRLIEKLHIVNGHATGGGIAFNGAVGGTIRDCKISANIGIFSRGGGPNLISNVTQIGNEQPGNIGMILNGACTVINCDLTHLGDGIRASSHGLTVIGTRFEVNRRGIVLGMDYDGSNFQSSGCFISGGSMESNSTAIYMHAAAGVSISGLSIQGHFNADGGAAPGNTHPVYGIDCSGGSAFVVNGVSVSGYFTGACINAANYGGGTFISCIVNNTAGGPKWKLHTNAAVHQFINCGAVP